MKDIKTLPDDIYALLQSQPRGSPEEVADKLSAYGGRAATLLNKQLTARDRPREHMVLYASELGKRCLRQVWYAHNAPELAESLPANTKFKFLYGDLIEEVVLTLAEQAGHDVINRQLTMEYKLPSGWVVRGRMDAVIDGTLIDVKSSSHYGMRKFAEGLTDENDAFGYRQQLSFYNGVGSAISPQGFLAIDKQNGDIGYFPAPWVPTGGIISDMTIAIEQPMEPARIAKAEEDAAYANKKLGIECSYCPYKRACWRTANKGAGLVRLGYASGPVWLTHVNTMPKVPAIPEPAPHNVHEVLGTAAERNKL